MRRLALWWLAVGLVLWAAAASLLVIDARTDLERGRESFELAIEHARDGSVQEVRLEVEVAAASLDDADDSLAHPLLVPLRVVPVLGRQLRSASGIASFAADVSREAETLLELVALDGSDAPVAIQDVDLEAMEFSAKRLHARLLDPDLGPDAGLAAPIADARQELVDLIAVQEPTVARSVDALVGLRSMMTGSTYLLLGANNAEMQVAGGMILSVGEVGLDDDGIEFGGLESTEELFPVPRTPIVDVDVENRWGFTVLSNDFRKLSVTTRFADFVGPQSVQLWEAETGRTVDGALLLDAHALAALLGTVGTVTVGGDTYDSDSLRYYLLEGQYQEFGNSDFEQLRRRNKLSEVSAAVLDALVAGPHDLGALLDAIPALVRGRHIQAFSAVQEQQAAWQALDIAGAPDGDEIGVFLSNFGASKLDPYIDVEVIGQTRSEIVDGNRVIELAVTVSNRVGDGSALADYVVGPWNWIDLQEPGEYLSRLVVVLPGSTSDAGFVSSTPLEVFGPDGPNVVLGTRFSVRPGEQRTVRLEATIPAALDALTVVSSARPNPVRWTWGSDTFDDSQGHAVRLGEP